MKNAANDATPDKLILQAVHFDFTAAMQNVLREKISVLLRHNDRIVRLNVRLNRDEKHGKKSHYTATGQIEIAGPDIVATVKGEDAYNVIDGLVERLDEQLNARSQRRKDQRNNPDAVELSRGLKNQTR
ncbi:MAG: hypothetical protein RIQ93_2012 [Verrucomicrobiota bacterium]|jgi:putative sigma-54 modulation protein